MEIRLKLKEWRKKRGLTQMALAAESGVGYATIARLHHIDFEENGNACYTDIWREFPGVSEVMELDTEPQAAD